MIIENKSYINKNIKDINENIRDIYKNIRDLFKTVARENSVLKANKQNVKSYILLIFAL